MAGLHFQASLFRSCLRTGETLQLQDAQKHPRVAATCRREGIGSLIMVPIFRNREVAGAIEFFFQEKRSFSPGDVMDLGLIAGVISESLGGSKNVGVKLASVHPSEPKPTPAPAPSLKAARGWQKEEELTFGQTSSGGVDKMDSKMPITESINPASTVADTSAKKLPTSPGQLWHNVKKAILTRQPRRL